MEAPLAKITAKVAELDHIIAQVYDCVLDEKCWPGLLTSLNGLVGGDSALVYLKPRSGFGGSLLTSRGFDPSYKVDRYLTYYEQTSPLIAYYRDQPAGVVKALGRYAFSATYRETEYFQDWVRPQGFADILGGHLARTPQVYAWLSIRRNEKRGTYSKPEVRLANCVVGHMHRAISLRSKFDFEHCALDNVRQSLEVVAFGVLIVDVNAKIIMGNSAAESMLRESKAIQAQHGRLVCKRTHDTGALHQAIRQAACKFDVFQRVSADLQIACDTDSRTVMMHVVPMGPGSLWCGLAPSPAAAAVFIVDPSRWTANVDRFAAIYRLTDAERRTLSEIMTAGGVVVAAKKLGISVPTVRTHLQHIFEKTGTNNQAELVRLVMMSPLSSRLSNQ